MKCCTRCEVVKEVTMFYKNKNLKDGLTYWCKSCYNDKQNLRRKKNPDKHRQEALDYYYKNKDKIREKAKAQYIPRNTRIRTKEKTAATKRKWRQNNLHLVREDAAYRRSLQLQACPPWADRNKIKAIYKDAQNRRKAGENVHVDHIIPLRGKNVCGLHIAENLQIISATENLKKGK